MVYNPPRQQRTVGGGPGDRHPDRPGGPGGPPPTPESITQLRTLLQAKGFADDDVMGRAELVAKDLARGVSGAKGESGRTQVRKVYNQARTLVGKARQKDFTAVRPDVRLLQAHIAYAVGRETLGPEFKVFFDAATDRLLRMNTGAELEAFLKFFEAMYAYFYFSTSKYGR